MSNSVFQFFPYGWKRPRGFIGNIKYIPRMLKWAKQRIMRGYADCDVWNFDGFLVKIIPAALRQLAEGYSYPHEFNTHEEWSKWLKETADMLEEGADNEWWINWDMPGETYQKEDERRKLIFNEAFDRLKEQFGNLWD